MATMVDTVVRTVKQHGFVVKEVTPPSFSTARHSPFITEGGSDAGAGAEARELSSSLSSTPRPALNRASLGLLSSRSSVLASAAAAAVSDAATYGVSPGLRRAGDVRPAEFTHLTPGVKKLMRSVMRGLKAHQDPEAATEGLGGTYFFRNESGAKIAIMKPCDEEPLAPNNPKGFVGRQLGEPGLKPTVRVGEAASREVAAYLLDHEHFARVPHTVMVRMSHPVFHVAEGGDCGGAEGPGGDGEGAGEWDTPEGLPLKLGSLQEFAPHECDTSEMGASRFRVDDVHRIGILDIRLFNTDRHAGNILVRRARSHGSVSRGLDGAPSALADHLTEPYELIPIDHGFALPEALEPPYFEWQHWPQALMPFSPEELDYIARLDATADAELLRRELPGLREESLRLLQVSTTLLQRAAAAGLSLSEIADVVTRPLIGLDDEPSELEQLCADVRACLDAGVSGSDEECCDSVGGSDSGGEERGLSDLEEEDEEGVQDESTGNASNSAIAASVASATQFSLLRGDAVTAAAAAATLPAAGAATPARPDLMGSDASRQTASMDDAVFCMDEESRTPQAGSPVGFAPLRRLTARQLKSAPSLVVKRSGEFATPGAVVGMSFGSALASASYDSDSPTAVGDAPCGSSSSALGSQRNSLDEGGPSSAGRANCSPPRGFPSAAKPSARGSRAGKERRRGRGSHAGKGGRAKAYPPLMKARSAAPSSAVFSGLSEDQWEDFMRLLEQRIALALRANKWTQCAAGPNVPLMSCPRF